MAFQVSPGINVSEIDLTTVVPSVSTTEGAIAGVFRWGPVNERILVSSEVELARRFGAPKTGYNEETFFTAADFLAYSNALYVTRVDNGNTAIASTGITDFSAKYPGALGNSIQVVAVSGAQYSSANSSIKAILRNEPSANNNLHVVIVDEDGEFTGTAGNVLEAFEDLSLTEGAKLIDGSNNYLIDVINTRSRYVEISESANTAAIEATVTAGVFTSSLTGGTDGDSESEITAGTITTAYELYRSPEDVEISLILQGKALGTDDAEIANKITDIASDRKDCVAFASPARADVVNNAGSERADILAWAANLTSSSYLVVDSGYKYRYDKYNDRYVYTPLNGDIAGLCVRTDSLRDPWFSPAGYNRGTIKNIVKLAYNPDKADRDQLYPKGINPVITQPGQGTLLFGDKTYLQTPSAFDRINVRRLFIVLEKAISRASKFALFEFNDEFTRAQFVNLVEPFLRDVQGRRGIYDFRVVCDTTNNTPEIIDRNEFVGDIYIKPARSINFIQLNFVAVRTGVEFEEIVGRF